MTDITQVRRSYHAFIANPRAADSPCPSPSSWPMWRGVPVIKYPADLLTYHEIICTTRPDLIIECGTAFGGSALFFADTMRALRHGKVVTVDVRKRRLRTTCDKRVTFIVGSSISTEVVGRIAELARGQRTMVILDSSHRAKHVAKELDLYWGMVSPGCYLVVEDTILNNHPVQQDLRPGPYEALQPFLAEHGEEFEQMPWSNKTMVSLNIGGWLRRRGGDG